VTAEQTKLFEPRKRGGANLRGKGKAAEYYHLLRGYPNVWVRATDLLKVRNSMCLATVLSSIRRALPDNEALENHCEEQRGGEVFSWYRLRTADCPPEVAAKRPTMATPSLSEQLGSPVPGQTGG
jgi:hypothetical protein